MIAKLRLDHLVFAGMACLMVGAQSGTAAAQARFGTMCQKGYESGWCATLDEAYNRCGWFNDELDDTDTKVYYYNLVNAASGIENSNDQAALETVNLSYINTHGGVNSTDAALAMWNYYTYAWSTNMRLGDESYGLSIMSNYSCHTLQTDNLWGRWGNAMRGGLRIVTGSHDIVWDGTTTNEVGEDYADNLQGSQSVKNAWKDGNSDWWEDQDIAVLASGNTLADCESRRDGIKWQNYPNYARRRDGDVQWLCWTTWNNL